MQRPSFAVECMDRSEGDRRTADMPATVHLAMDVLRVSVNQGGGRESVLELDVPAHVSTARLISGLEAVYRDEGLPEWHQGSFSAALAACAGAEGSTGSNNPWTAVRGNDDEVVEAAMRELLVRGGDAGQGGRAEDVELHEAYSLVMRMGQAGDAILNMERGFREATREMVEGREAFEAEEDKQRQREVQAQILKSTFASEEESKKQFEQLSARHLERSKRAFKEWRRGMAEMHKQQKQNFRKYVLEAAETERARMAGASRVEAGLARSKCDAGSVWKKMLYGKDGVCAGEQAGRKEREGGSFRMQRPRALQISAGSSQMKKVVLVHVRAGSPLDYCQPASSRHANEQGAVSKCLVGGGIMAVILPSAPPQPGKKFHVCPELVGAAFSCTELVFQDLPVQLEAALEGCDPARLRTGDWFTTRHSNLAGCHVIFHVITESGALGSPDRELLQSLSEVLSAIAPLGVSALAFPLLMTDPLNSSPSQSRQLGGAGGWFERASAVLKVVRSGLLGLDRNFGSLQLLHVLVPPEMEAIDQAASLLRSVCGAHDPPVSVAQLQVGTR